MLLELTAQFILHKIVACFLISPEMLLSSLLVRNKCMSSSIRGYHAKYAKNPFLRMSAAATSFGSPFFMTCTSISSKTTVLVVRKKFNTFIRAFPREILNAQNLLESRLRPLLLSTSKLLDAIAVKRNDTMNSVQLFSSLIKM